MTWCARSRRRCEARLSPVPVSHGCEACLSSLPPFAQCYDCCLLPCPLLSVTVRYCPQCYNAFLQSEHFAYILELKSKEGIIPALPDFRLIRVLGQGGFGQVLEVVKRDCGKRYAMKVQRKAQLISSLEGAGLDKSWQEVVLTERDLQANLFHPLLVNLAYAFQVRDLHRMHAAHIAHGPPVITHIHLAVTPLADAGAPAARDGLVLGRRPRRLCPRRVGHEASHLGAGERPGRHTADS